jgi:hypothetical protein
MRSLPVLPFEAAAAAEVAAEMAAVRSGVGGASMKMAIDATKMSAANTTPTCG